MPTHSLFDVDRDGLAALMHRRGKEHALIELVANALDTETAIVRVTLTELDDELAAFSVEDEHPDGFAQLAHAYTLFAHSEKRGDASTRGRFNLGEKLLIALCREVRITSTTGSVVFADNQRTHRDERRDRGSLVEGVIAMSRHERERAEERIAQLIAPGEVRVELNGAALPQRRPAAELEAVLPTEIADAEGVMRRTERRCLVRLCRPRPGEAALIYELGVPIVESGGDYHVDVQQKVPLGLERDAVTPAYLKALHIVTANAVAPFMSEDDARSDWANTALGDARISDEAIEAILTHRFGRRRALRDTNNPIATRRAADEGYTIVQPRSLSRDQWTQVRRAGAIPPAGQVYPASVNDEPATPSHDQGPSEEAVCSRSDTVGVAPEASQVDTAGARAVVATDELDETAKRFGQRAALLLGAITGLELDQRLEGGFLAVYEPRRRAALWLENASGATLLLILNTAAPVPGAMLEQDALVAVLASDASVRYQQAEPRGALARTAARLARVAARLPDLFCDEGDAHSPAA